MIQDNIKDAIMQCTDSNDCYEKEMIQELWSGYGHIIRYSLKGSKKYNQVVVKHIDLNQNNNHSRGWATDRSHQRKLRSYEVETNWYYDWANLCDDECRIPHCLSIKKQKNEMLIVMEDLEDAGYTARKSSIKWSQIEVVLNWLANFHATFMREKPKGLWKTGTYWHLKTRPDELKALNDKSLKQVAKAIDDCLNQAKYKTFVHGDAKLANFTFTKDLKHVAAVDFQYVGGGIGMKDVAYFIGSCLYEHECEQLESKMLNSYFHALKKAFQNKKKDIAFTELEKEWRSLYHVAWADFHRFLKGWSPEHWKINSYSEKVSRQVIERFQK